MDPGPRRELAARARALLEPARKIPASLDALSSCLLARGLAHLDPEAGLARLVRLFEGQWSQGLVPHRVTHHGAEAPPADLAPYRVPARAHGLPRGVATSCLSAPPAAGLALGALAQAGAPVEPDFFERFVLAHHWLSTARDPAGDGVLLLLHPLESEAPTSLRFAPVLETTEGSADGVSPGSAEDPLLPALSQAGADASRLAPRHAFRIQDPFATGLLAASNRALIGLARHLHRTRDMRRLEVLQERFLGGFAKVFPELAPRDRAGGKPLPATLAGPAGAALLSGPGRGRSQVDFAGLSEGAFALAKARVPGLLPSAAPALPGFDPAAPARGAASLLEHFALSRGLDPADPRRIALVDLVLTLALETGPAEHWHALEAEPVAGRDTSLAAALVLALTEEEPR